MSNKLKQGELLNNAIKESLQREEQRLARYLHLSNTIKDARLNSLFGGFANNSFDRLKQLKNLMKHFNIK